MSLRRGSQSRWPGSPKTDEEAVEEPVAEAAEAVAGGREQRRRLRNRW
jgi:hypothetical protein